MLLLSVKDIELLKLICWCKSIPCSAQEDFISFFDRHDIVSLERAGLVSFSRDGRNIRPQTKAYELLAETGFVFRSESKPQTGESVIRRRNISSRILMTFYRAGAEVFSDTLSTESIKPQYVTSSAARAASDYNLGKRPFGSTKYYGVLGIPQEAFMVFYVDGTGVYYRKELTLLRWLVQNIGANKMSLVFMGESTSGIADTVFGGKDNPSAKAKYRPDTFGTIFDTSSLPIHFIPIGDAGSQVIKFMLIPNYREALARAILRSGYQPPYPGLTDTDTIHFYRDQPRNPAVVGADMDVRRIDRALAQSKAAGFPKIVIYALREQMNFLRSRYRASGEADVLEINLEYIMKQMDYDQNLYQPSVEPYVTKDGRYFDVSEISRYRKTKSRYETADEVPGQG